MLFSDSFFTITSSAEAVFKDRGSKFLAFAYPVSNEAEIKEHLLTLRKLHHGARHHCYAWRLGPDGSASRVNDDGEPSNTAGKPIFAQIQARELTGILIVVVRYFGGTLLGVGGLINAYRSAAAMVIEQAEVVERFIEFDYELVYPAADTSQVMRILKESEAQVLSSDYENMNIIRFRIRKQRSEAAEQKFADLYTVKLRFLNTAL